MFCRSLQIPEMWRKIYYNILQMFVFWKFNTQLFTRISQKLGANWRKNRPENAGYMELNCISCRWKLNLGHRKRAAHQVQSKRGKCGKAQDGRSAGLLTCAHRRAELEVARPYPERHWKKSMVLLSKYTTLETSTFSKILISCSQISCASRAWDLVPEGYIVPWP